MRWRPTNPTKARAELRQVAEVCRRVPAEAPRNFWGTLQMYWFVHLGTITELNGWDAMNPGHLDQHLGPFMSGTRRREARQRRGERASLLFLDQGEQHAGAAESRVTAAESGTYNDFTNINLGGIKADGSDGSNEVSYLALEVLDELQLLQPRPTFR